MKAKPVADMRQIGRVGTHAVDEGKGFFQVEMGVVRLLPQGVDHQYLNAFQSCFFLGRHGFDIRQVGEIPNAETKNLQAVVTGVQRDDLLLCDMEGLSLFQQVDRNGWRSGIPVFIGKDIVETALQAFNHPRVGIDRDVSLPKKKGTDIIDPGSMVGMLVGKKDGIKLTDRVSKHLLPKVRAAIDYDVTSAVGLDQD